MENLKERKLERYMEELNREETIELDDVTQKMGLNREKLAVEDVGLRTCERRRDRCPTTASSITSQGAAMSDSGFSRTSECPEQDRRDQRTFGTRAPRSRASSKDQPERKARAEAEQRRPGRFGVSRARPRTGGESNGMGHSRGWLDRGKRGRQGGVGAVRDTRVAHQGGHQAGIGVRPEAAVPAKARWVSCS